MCHLVLLAPVFGLGLFLVLPLPLAAPIYLVILVASLLMYRAIHRAQCIPVKSGPEKLPGSRGTVCWSREDHVMVTVRGEYWTAEVAGTVGDKMGGGANRPPRLPEGSAVRVVGRRRNRLLVVPEPDSR